MSDPDAEMALYAEIAPLMTAECGLCRPSWPGYVELVDGPRKPCPACHGAGKATPLMWGNDSPKYLYWKEGSPPIVPLDLVLETAAKMGLCVHEQPTLDRRNPTTEWGGFSFGFHVSNAPTPTLAVLRAIKAALDART